ncbi:uncharacterized protein EI90DRAFT_3019761 [Cantharellus anzutake]|uniref:uncharacterized protein n=1 Tax=Cantharellus anzutake TaxID=1750568 RepID=UPI0019087797|nr:uncharacterized protein EI90DRAFT_3019761 [Cantharellus anzutake]KAF8324211.1 hypothetical protein EI90DRAFT_3019761 [Cantharellus anzutake]
MLTTEHQSQPLLQSPNEMNERQPFDRMDVSEVDMLHAEHSIQITNEELSIAKAAHLYAFTENTYFRSRLFRIPRSAERDPERQWDKEFIDECHLREFRDWPMLPNSIRDGIPDLAVQKRINDSICKVRRQLKHQILENHSTWSAVFTFWNKQMGPLWECDRAKELRGNQNANGQYPDNPPVLFPPGEPDPKFFMDSPYVVEGMRVLLFGSRGPLFNCEEDAPVSLRSSAWEHSAANCAAKKYKITAVTPGLVALAAIGIWSVLLPPEDRADVEVKFHRWRKLLIKTLAYEDSYPPGVRQYFHETMERHNVLLFSNSMKPGQADSESMGNDETGVEEFNFEKQLEASIKAQRMIDSDLAGTSVPDNQANGGNKVSQTPLFIPSEPGTPEPSISNDKDNGDPVADPPTTWRPIMQKMIVPPGEMMVWDLESELLEQSATENSRLSVRDCSVPRDSPALRPRAKVESDPSEVQEINQRCTQRQAQNQKALAGKHQVAEELPTPTREIVSWGRGVRGAQSAQVVRGAQGWDGGRGKARVPESMAMFTKRSGRCVVGTNY